MAESENSVRQANVQNAVVGINPPKTLIVTTENMANTWKLWKQQFEFYAIAIQMEAKPPNMQLTVLMSIIGTDALMIYNTFEFADDEERNLQSVIKKFDDHFIPKVNVTFERYVFNSLNQKQDETFEEFYTNVINKSKSCEYGTLLNTILRDKIVIGIHNDEVRKK